MCRALRAPGRLAGPGLEHKGRLALWSVLSQVSGEWKDVEKEPFIYIFLMGAKKLFLCIFILINVS